MTIAIDKLGIESVLIVEIFWCEGASILYSDKAIADPLSIGYCTGKLLQANVISKTGQIDQSGVSKTASVTISELKSMYDSYKMEGIVCNLYQYIIQGTPILRLLMSGVISSDIAWLEGERAISFSVEGGTNRTGQSGEIGYAPEEDAFIGLNPGAIGINWPVVFGTAVKVPAVRIEYYDDLTLADHVDYNDDTFVIINGEQLPQTPTTIQLIIDNILFEGTMTDDVFTPTGKNLPKYTNQVWAERIGTPDDIINFFMAWVPEGVNLAETYVWVHRTDGQDFVNYCTTQIGTKCIFAQAWYGWLSDDTDDITEAAAYPRTSWPKTFQVYSESNNGNILLETSRDGWGIYKDTLVIYNAGTDYMDRYVVNLYPSSNILAVWSKRTFNNHSIWAKVPSSYYHIHLNEAITTAPGAVVRHCTFIDFPQPLKNFKCENWENEIYVTLESTLPSTPKEIVEWVTDTLTEFTFDISSDDPPVTMNFAYFETTDAIEFLRGIAYQSASVIQITETSLQLIFLAQEPGTYSGEMHIFDDDKIIMKSLALGFKAKEEINTVHKSIYVIDYSGEKSSKKIYEISQNVEILGRQTIEDDMWALTCETPVKAVTDFWGIKTGNSWKTVKMDCFLDLTDAEVYNGATFDIDPFVPTGVRGLLTSVIHDTDRPMVTIEVELAVKAGELVEDPNYWNFGPATCVAPTDSQEDYIPELDPECTKWSIDIGQQTPRSTYHPVIVKWPPHIYWNVPFDLEVNLHDKDDVLVEENVTFFMAKIYTTDPGAGLIDYDGVEMVAGILLLENITLRRGILPGNIHLNLSTYDEKVRSGDVYPWRPRHI